ncbi:MAG: biopolymer transporter ExbD [Candidatus Marinimicrobia bacterium]|mgnify:FL=1|nr:biopolymer transporter ExbD [Candidatus Neomarinimicrobiota bacterium]|tara:strand:- start:1711 stop:2115 length:405 start_codon:yes stop_codon:yes gene_type:complete
MKFSTDNKSSFSIEITPLIDIVFLLVIFFVVTSKVGDSQFLSLDLPKTESFQYKTVQSVNEIIIIGDGSVFINNKLFNIDDLNDLEQAIFELENNKNSLILSAESTALHLWVITVMDILNKNGFNEVQIRTIEK